MANKVARMEAEAKEAKKIASTKYSFKKKFIKPPKKKSAEDLYIELKLQEFCEQEIRSKDSYSPASFNHERQKSDLFKHLYVKYPIPNFFYDMMKERSAISAGYPKNYYIQTHNYEVDWFFCLAQGGSFQKMVKDIMTKKEVILYLTAPENYSIKTAFLYAKMKIRGMSDSTIYRLIRKDFFNLINPMSYTRNEERFNALLDFYAKFSPEMSEQDFDAITDFILHRSNNNDNFSLKGRTLASVMLLSETWHTLSQKSDLGKTTRWEGVQEKIWSVENEKEEFIWEIKELKSNIELINEGRKQHHCVGSYVSLCASGRCNIFSLRRYNSKSLNEHIGSRVTIQLVGNDIGQVYKFLNSLPLDSEKRIIRSWASSMGYHYSPRKW